MADDDVVVKKDKDGRITVCIGDRCVTVPCGEVEEEEVEVGTGPITFDVMKRAEALGDLESLEWNQAAPEVKTTRTADGSRLARRRVS